MPVTVEGPFRTHLRHRGKFTRAATHTLRIALVNNMPDAALADTEAQFSGILGAASGPHTVRLHLTALPEVARGDSAREHMGALYWPLEELLASAVDGLIVTGMEPGPGPLSDEPCWARFGELIAWARTHTASSIWSCLAAHAAVAHLDGIQRVRLDSKRFGVFEHALLGAHPLVAGVRAPLTMPHSRWNELPPERLRAAGYALLTGSAFTGADLFVKNVGSLFVFFQGHPEYEATTLFREYRRDVARFVRGQLPGYPNLPHGCFDAEATAQLDTFRRQALQACDPECLAQFPGDRVAGSLRNSWRDAAVRIYGNWLAFVAAAKRGHGSAALAGIRS